LPQTSPAGAATLRTACGELVNPISKTVLKRLGLGAITLLVVSVIISFAVALLPGDFAKAVLGQAATPETVAAFQREIGLDRSPVERYLEWIGGVVQGDFGQSYAGAGSLGGHRRDVADLIAPRLVNTLILAGVAALVAVPLALVLGLLAALYRNSIFDRAVNLVTLTAISAPEFFLAYILMLFLAVRWPVFHALSSVSPDTSPFEHLQRIALPALTLILVIVAHMMRMTRAAIINLLASPYIEMARLKGVSPRRIITHHALANAWAPIANVIALNLAYLVVGVVVVEVVFAYPGIGQLMVDAVSKRDLPVVQGCALIFAATYILLNLGADIVAIVTNPRLLHPR
jgi:peptide/nickel transport system permease protein